MFFLRLFLPDHPKVFQEIRDKELLLGWELDWVRVIGQGLEKQN